MVSARRKYVVKQYARKFFSIAGFKRAFTNAPSIYRFAKSFIFDVNLRSRSVKENLEIDEQSIGTLSEIANQFNPPNPSQGFDLWLPTVPNEKNTYELGNLLKNHGSDKSTEHDYHEVYGAILAGKRNYPLNILEIGLGTNNLRFVSNMGLGGRPGASLRAFRDWGPNANIYGADIDQGVLFQEERVSTFWVDQTNKDALRELARRFENIKFDLIIDDGLHLPHANFNTLQIFLPLLSESGTFVVEDIDPLHCKLWDLCGLALAPKYDTHFTKRKGGFIFVARNAAHEVRAQ